MPRTEKRFGVVNQPTASTPTELVPTAATTRNILINATARTTAAISAAIYSGAYSNDATGSIVISSFSVISSIPNSSVLSASNNICFIYTGRDNVYNQASNTATQNKLMVIDPNTNSILYVGNTNLITGSEGFRNSSANTYGYKTWTSLNGGPSPFTPRYQMYSSSRAIGINGSVTTSTTASVGIVSINHVTGSSISESTLYSQYAWQSGAQQVAGGNDCGAHPLQDGVAMIFHTATTTPTATNTGLGALGIYIASDSSQNLEKRAYWNLDGTANKNSGLAISYFFVSSYNSTYSEFAFSQPSTTTLWSGIAPTSSTSWPAGYTLPSAAAPAAFRIVSNTSTTAPTDTNFLTGTITYPDAPTGVTVPTGYIPVVSMRFSPDNTKLAVAYRRDYSGTGDTNSVVVIYTKQGNGSWLHTHSSGSRIPYAPHTQNSMAWSGDSGSIAVCGSTSTTIDTMTAIGSAPSSTTLPVYFWNITTGSSGYVANQSVNSWTNLSTKYPDFLEYTSPKTGSSTISSSLQTVINYPFVGQIAGRNFGSLQHTRTSGNNSAGGFSLGISASATSLNYETHQYAIMQTSGTVGVSGQPASNYVTTVISDLSLIPGETSQVSNIVLGSGERVIVESSTSNSVDVSAHGVEST